MLLFLSSRRGLIALGYSNEVLNLGLDVGSTTAKLVFLDEEGQLVMRIMSVTMPILEAL